MKRNNPRTKDPALEVHLHPLVHHAKTKRLLLRKNDVHHGLLATALMIPVKESIQGKMQTLKSGKRRIVYKRKGITAQTIETLQVLIQIGAVRLVKNIEADLVLLKDPDAGMTIEIGIGTGKGIGGTETETVRGNGNVKERETAGVVPWSGRGNGKGSEKGQEESESGRGTEKGTAIEKGRE